MAWNDQMTSVPGTGGRPDADGTIGAAAPQVQSVQPMPVAQDAPLAPPPIAPPIDMGQPASPLTPLPGAGPVAGPTAEAMTSSPQSSPLASPLAVPPAPVVPAGVNGMPGQSGRGPVTGGQRPAMRQQAPKDDHRDDIWVDRARKAIAQTQNDPYRQVQLLQQLNRLYLKERFNRDVKGDSQSDFMAETKI